MFEWFKARVLGWMKVPHEPDPPLGAPGSVRVFRAGLNHYRIRVVRWALGQVGAVVGIGFSLFFLGAMEVGVEQARQVAASPSPSVDGDTERAAPTATPSRSRSRAERQRERERAMANLVARTPPFVLPLIRFLEVGGVAFLLAQMLLTFAIVRLEFEQHWYIVTDRSLRIRTGVLRLQESTMSFANIQQVEIKQGPLQRLLGLSDICVRSAGGGDQGQEAQSRRHEESLHLGVFAGVSNALEIRDLILHRLRKFRESGLGDPEDRRPAPTDERAGSAMPEAVAELLAETRALRRTLVGGS